jgi:hypothetical protein
VGLQVISFLASLHFSFFFFAHNQHIILSWSEMRRSNHLTCLFFKSNWGSHANTGLFHCQM